MNTRDSRQAEQPQRRGAPWPLILILACIFIPIVAAYVTYYTGFGVSEETVNEGVLLEPPVKVDLLVAEATDEVPKMAEDEWRLFLPVSAPCNDACAKNLYTTRQVHIRLGEKATRVERIAVNLAGAEGNALLEELKAEHPLLKHFSVEPGKWDQWLKGTNAPDRVKDSYYVLVDPRGYAMMYYTVEHHGNQLLDDLKRILRYTPE